MGQAVKHFFMTAASISLALAAIPSNASAGTTGDIPHLETRDGRHALIVDGAPFLVLGAQTHNSSNYPGSLEKVWPVLDRMHANTLEIPVAWQQIEPAEGKFDFSFVQTLLDQARSHDKRVILLWFGTWKNTSPAYTPDWVKLDNRRFPRMKTRSGNNHDVLTPLARTTLDADKRAFTALMTFLRDNDRQNTVILVQPENEVGSYRNPRDFGPEGNRLFTQAIPAVLAQRTGRKGTWSSAFGPQADRAFNTWYTARYVNEIVAAGKAVKPLPMYVNASLAGPSNVPDPDGVASGGPQQDVLDIWKAAAPSIDFAAPDIYDRKSSNVGMYLDAYKRRDNALMVPEIGNSRDFARYAYAAFGRGAIGFSPFGMDATGFNNFPLGARELDAATLDTFALPYATFAAINRQWARLAFEHPTWGAAKPDDNSTISTKLGAWTISASWGEWQFGRKEWAWLKAPPPPWSSEPLGGLAVTMMKDNEFLLVGDHVRVEIRGSESGSDNAVILRVEEGHFEGDAWIMERIWNGDQTDYGINLTDRPVVLRVVMGHYH